jgi:hypothetical protein
MFTADALSAEKAQKQKPPLSKEEVQKLRDIAVIIAGEIARKNIKTVTVMNFTDIKGNPSKKGRTVAAEFRKQIETIGKARFAVVDAGGGAFVKGMFLPFKGGDKWRLDIKVLSPDNRLITSYSAFYRKTKGLKR